MDEGTIRRKMQDVLGIVSSDMGSIRTGRATTGVVEGVKILAYGGQQEMKLNELATISTPDPQTIVIDPWDKSIIGDIKKGILAANVGLNPAIDGQIIRISLPPLTTEDREKYVKLLSVKIENGKIMLRQIRAEEMKDIRARFEEKALTKDDKFKEEETLQKITDEFVGKIDEAGEKKKQELLQI